MHPAHLHVETPDSYRRHRAYRHSDHHAEYERTEEMFRTVNGEKAKRLSPRARTAAFTILWVVVACAAMALIAFAGHV
jgi:hypothetical protein